jgi:hypothetical protein
MWCGAIEALEAALPPPLPLDGRWKDAWNILWLPSLLPRRPSNSQICGYLPGDHQLGNRGFCGLHRSAAATCSYMQAVLDLDIAGPLETNLTKHLTSQLSLCYLCEGGGR